MHYKILAVVLLLGTLLAACEDSTPEAADEEARVVVEDVEYQELPGGARILTGTVYNRSSEPIDAVQLQVSLYDALNQRIAGMHVIVRDIPPGERKSFREAVDSELDVRGARVRSVLIL